MLHELFDPTTLAIVAAAIVALFWDKVGPFVKSLLAGKKPLPAPDELEAIVIPDDEPIDEQTHVAIGVSALLVERRRWVSVGRQDVVRKLTDAIATIVRPSAEGSTRRAKPAATKPENGDPSDG